MCTGIRAWSEIDIQGLDDMVVDLYCELLLTIGSGK